MVNKECKSCKITKSVNDFYNRHLSCKECCKLKNRSEEYKLYKKEYYKKNKDSKIKDYYENLTEIEVDKIKLQKNLSYKKNKDKWKENSKTSRRLYHNKKLLTDPIYKLKVSIRRRLNKSLKSLNFVKSNTLNISEVLGCDYEFFINYIESKFEHWMSWSNYGKYNGDFNYGWDLDHIKPLSTSNSESDVIKLNHYSNLQPLCSKFNRDIKNDK